MRAAEVRSTLDLRRLRTLLLAGALAILALVALVLALREAMPMGYDFYHWYWRIPRQWLAGETLLYDGLAAGFYYPPWAVWVLMPFSLLDMQTGMALLATVSVAGVAGVALHAARDAGARPAGLWAVAAVLCPYALQVWFVGTHDAFGVVGVYLAWLALRSNRPLGFGAALVLAAVRPQHLVFAGPVLVMLAVKQWGWGALLRAALVPAAVMMLSGVTFGFDWPVRLVRHIVERPPGGYIGAPRPYLITSTYDALKLVGIPPIAGLAGALMLSVWSGVYAWRAGVTRSTLDRTLVVNAIVSPHFHSQSYVVLLAIPWLSLGARRPWLAVAMYSMSLLLLARAGGLWDLLGVVDVLFPLLLLVALTVVRLRDRPIWRLTSQLESTRSGRLAGGYGSRAEGVVERSAEGPVGRAAQNSIAPTAESPLISQRPGA